MLDKLKKNKNPYYKFFDDFNTFQNRCRITDPTGYSVIFQDDVNEDLPLIDGKQLNELVDELEKEKNEEDDEDTGEKDEIELRTKDPIKKFQFIYSESLCMTSKYPEISRSSDRTRIEVAPGEGQVPRDIMSATMN